MADLLAAFTLVFVAELGDKSMLLALAFAARYRPAPVLAGIAVAASVMLGASVVFGSVLGNAMPQRALAISGGLLFLGFGVWTLRGEHGDEAASERRSGRRGGSVLLGVMLAFLVAEFGDKTMLATVALASTRAALPTWIGAMLGMTLASGLAVLLAVRFGRLLPARRLQLAAAGLFLLFGVVLLVEGIRG